MKKFIVLFGVLSVVSVALAGGKEVVPKPEAVVVREVVVEKTTDSEIPSGYVELYYEWRGKSGAHKKYGSKDYLTSNYGFSHLEGEIQFTEKQKIYFEVEDFSPWSSPRANDTWETEETHTDLTLEYTYQHDFLGGMASKLIYKNNDVGNGGAEEATGHVLEYQAQWNLAEKLLNNDFIKTTDFTIAPKIGYNWNKNSDWSAPGEYYYQDTYYGLDLYSTYELPWNFEIEFNLYFTQHSYNRRLSSNENKKKNFTAAMELYLFNTTKLVEFGQTTLSFYFEGGYDPYTYSQRKIFAHDVLASSKDDNSSYTLYALPALRLDYQATDKLGIYFVAGARMENIHTTASEAQGFQFQPVAQIGFKIEF
ncbi:MAG: hypothetical protein LBT51_06740 [Fusobacteriaceae bacterium]|jgi:hypothetical protein|nr:hypothetical protein [Fusobacteriaceae bacterium]